MKNPRPLSPVDPESHFTPDDAVNQWGQSEGSPAPGFPPEVPRRPPNEKPEWTPKNPQELPTPNPNPIPDWSPSSDIAQHRKVVENRFPALKQDTPPRPTGQYNPEGSPDERIGPVVVEDPSPTGEPADEGGDIEEPGAQNPIPNMGGTTPTSIRFTPSGREMRPTSEEAYY
ncbi:MAG: hypothetical protein ACKV19_28565 [Verrucomicrobiales bacterium]